MTKWLWYANFGILLLAVFTVFAGLSFLPDMPKDASVLLDVQSGSGNSGESGEITTSDSPLVEVARSYSQRWVPPRPPEPPRFSVVEVDIPEQGNSQVWLEIADACEPAAYVVGDIVDEYSIDTIDWQVVTVSKSDVSFPLDVPSPPAPPFAVTMTQMADANEGSAGKAWLKLPDEQEATAYELGDVLAGYELTDIQPRWAEVSLRGFQFVLDVPAPPAPTFIVERTLVDEAAAWIQPQDRDEAQRYVLGDEIDGYRLDQIEITAVVVSKIGFDYVVTVPAPPAPTFTVVAAMSANDPPAAMVRLQGGQDADMFTIGDEIDGYRLDAVGLRDITVSKIGYNYNVPVPRPLEPSFAVVETSPGDDANSIAWIQTEHDVPAEQYGIGAELDGFELRTIDSTSIIVNKANYDFEVVVPRPADPNFNVSRVDASGEYNWAWLYISKDAEPMAFTVGDRVEGFLLTGISQSEIYLNRLGYDYILQVPEPLTTPAAPPFRLAATLAFSKRNGLAWMNMPDSAIPQAFAVGEKVGDYYLVAVEDGLAQLSQDGYLFTLYIPIPEPRSIEADPCDVDNGSGQEGDGQSADANGAVSPIVPENRPNGPPPMVRPVNRGNVGPPAIRGREPR